jgi:hypothetical protein
MKCTTIEELPEDISQGLSSRLKEIFELLPELDDLCNKGQGSFSSIYRSSYQPKYSDNVNQEKSHLLIELMMGIIEGFNPSPYSGIALGTAHGPFVDHQMSRNEYSERAFRIFKNGVWTFVDTEFGENKTKDSALVTSCSDQGLVVTLVNQDLTEGLNIIAPESFDLATHTFYGEHNTDVPEQAYPEFVYEALRPGGFYLVYDGTARDLDRRFKGRFEKVFARHPEGFTHFCFSELYRKVDESVVPLDPIKDHLRSMSGLGTSTTPANQRILDRLKRGN